MNLNYLPVRAKVLEVCGLDGQVFEPGEEVEMAWIHMKQFEKAGKMERILPEEEAEIEPIRSVMVFTPVYRIEPETVLALMALEWDGPLTLLLQRDNPTKDGQKNILNQYTRAREQFLRLDYDAMLVIESDIIPPRDTLTRLAALNADVAYGVYSFRKSNVINVFERYPDSNGVRPPNVGESLSFKPWLLKRAVQLEKFPCSGGGLGACLIRRRVLQAIQFRRERDVGPDCDTYFTRDVYEKGFSMMADTRVVCGHKDEKGKILWPEM